MTSFKSITVVFPMWNEEAYVTRSVRRATAVCDELLESDEVADYEILLVDDGSTDRTGSIAEALARGDRRIRVVHHPENRGLGGSLKTGFAEASGELVCYLDADLPVDFWDLLPACRLIRTYEADVVSAYRLNRMSEGPRRAVYTLVYNWLIRLVFGMQVRDVNFAFKLFRRRILRHVALTSNGSFIDAELLIRSQRLGYKIIQFAVEYFPRSRGTSTLSSLGTIRGRNSTIVTSTPSAR